MILKNSKGIEKSFDVLFEIEKNNKRYIIYKDSITEKIYCGKYEDDKLKVVDDTEFEFINNIIDRLNS